MAVCTFTNVVDADMIKFIDPDTSRGMNDFASAKANTHMGYGTFLIVEKSQVAGTGFLNKADSCTKLYLLRCITGKVITGNTVDNL